MRFIEIQQVLGARHNKHRKTLTALGLNGIGRIEWAPDTPENRRMIDKVSHLIHINLDPAAPNASGIPSDYDERVGAALMRKLVFDAENVALERYSDAELKAGKTPDFKLFKDGAVCGYCEMKSPGDDYIFEKPAPGKFAVRKDLPFHVKLGLHISKAGLQFAAVNSDHKLPNILAFVNHAPDMNRGHRHEAIVGLPAGDGNRVAILSHELQVRVLEAARKIDLFLWIDAEKNTLQHVSVNGATHQQAALDLLGLSNQGAA
jgi:ribosomal protein L30